MFEFLFKICHCALFLEFLDHESCFQIVLFFVCLLTMSKRSKNKCEKVVSQLQSQQSNFVQNSIVIRKRFFPKNNFEIPRILFEKRTKPLCSYKWTFFKWNHQFHLFYFPPRVFIKHMLYFGK